MDPATLALIFSLVEELIKIEPSIAAELSAIFSKQNPTPDDWAALRVKVIGNSFSALAPAAAANLTPPPTPLVVSNPVQAADLAPKAVLTPQDTT